MVLGIGGNLVAPQDIWDSLGIVDTEHYRQLIKSLQELGILRSDLSKKLAQTRARKNRVSVRTIPRFKIGPTQQKQDSKGTSVKRSAIRAAASAVEEAQPDSPDPNARLWLRNLPSSVDDSALVEFLRSFGEVEELYIPRNHATGQSKGYAFVEFDK